MLLEWQYLLPIALGLLIASLLIGLPIFIGFLLLNIVGVLVLLGPSGFGMLANSIYSSSSSISLAAIPLFVLMGEILFRSGSVDILFDALGKLVGKLRGRLYYFVVVLSAVFGALSGSAIAVTAMLGKTALKTMIQRGYDQRMSASMILAGAALAPIIPPSTMAVVIGSVADVSISKLLLAGIIPGIVIACGYVIYIGVSIRMNPSLAPANEIVENVSFREKTFALIQCLPFATVIFSIMGFMLLGVATATEAAATGVLASLIVAACYRKLRWEMFVDSLKSAASVTAVLMVIVVSSTFYTQLLAFSGATSGLVNAITSLPIDGLMFTIGVLAITFVMCMFIDQIAYMLMVIPIVQPIMKSFGLDPVYFWCLFLIFISIGSNSPPFGYNLFTLYSVSENMTMKTIFSAGWISVAMIFAVIAVLFVFPQLITYLPSLI